MSNNTGSGYEEHRNSTAAAFSTPEGPLLAAEATTNAVCLRELSGAAKLMNNRVPT